MSKVKSFSVNNGDLFYINHFSDNFTIIDCNLEDSLENRSEIIKEITNLKKKKGVSRFISTHPDEDHISGIKDLTFTNFYCVKNEATKPEESESFKHYCSLRDNGAIYIKKNLTKSWLNQESDGRKSSGINFLWPDINNAEYKEILKKVKEGKEHNNLSPIIKYSITTGQKFLWMGDIMFDFLEKIKNDIEFSKINIVFAPHHGRKSGKIPVDVLTLLSPDLIIVGEAPSSDLEYYKDYQTITQNSSGDITFESEDNYIHIYVSKESYLKSKTKPNNLQNRYKINTNQSYYLGSLKVEEK